MVRSITRNTNFYEFGFTLFPKADFLRKGRFEFRKRKLGISVDAPKSTLTPEILAYHHTIIAKGGTDKINIGEV